MAINRDSNIYTIVFATIMVIVVGGLLAFISLSLKPLQKENVTNEKMQNILQAIGLEEMKTLQRSEAGEKFNDYVKRRITINYNGDIISDKTAADPIDPQDKEDAFNIDIRKEYSRYVKPIIRNFKGDDEKMKEALSNSNDIHFPIFVCENNGETYYVLSASGKGLWDDIWGYIGFKSDATTINGSVFDHKGETPGLGSKIAEAWFEDQFIGKTIAENNEFIPIEVLKPGKDKDNHQVDGISGATFTGVGVDEMLGRNLSVYYNFFKNNPEFGSNKKENIETITATEKVMTTSNVVDTADQAEGRVRSSILDKIDLLSFTDGFGMFFSNYDDLNNGEYHSFIIEGIKFSAGSSRINVKSSKVTLDLILKGLLDKPSATVELGGHTDNMGEEAQLLTLSEGRANAVKDYLVENGVEESRIFAKGYGASQPFQSNDTEDGRSKNRRTEIKITKNSISDNI